MIYSKSPTCLQDNYYNAIDLFMFEDVHVQWNLDITKCQGIGKIIFVRYIEGALYRVRFHIFYCNFGRMENNYHSLNRGLRYIEVCKIEVPQYQLRLGEKKI